MPLQINGSSFSWTGIGMAVTSIFWLAALSFQVRANGDDIEKQEETKERLVRIEERQEGFKEDINEVKDAQKENAKITAAILAAVQKE